MINSITIFTGGLNPINDAIDAFNTVNVSMQFPNPITLAIERL